MKKMTFAVWFTALLAVFSLTSCLDSDEGGIRQGSEIVKVEGYMGMYSFKSAAGYELIPSNMSAITMDINSPFAYISYSYDSNDVTETMKKINVEVMGIMPIRQQYVESELSMMEGYANAPIRNITGGQSYEFFPISFWDPNTMFLPINFLMKNTGTKEESAKELAAHSFEVFCDVNDEEALGESVLLRVRHRVVDPENNKDRYKINTNIYCIDLTHVMQDYRGSHDGKLPEMIYVEYEQNANGEYNEHAVYPAKAEVNYKVFVDLYNKTQQN